VQRWLKFAKYLPEFGWEPVVLTVDPEYAAYPVTDNSLNNEVPDSVKVYKTLATNYFSIYKKDKSRIPSAGFATNIDNSLKGKLLRFIRGNFFIPDPRKGWNNHAFKKACDLIKSEGIRHIITTSPPHSTQLIGLKLKRKYPQINWIADLRDPWTDIYYYNQFYPTVLSKSIDLQLERTVLKNADRLITVGDSLKKMFEAKVKGIGEKVEVITNGFDESDFNTFPPIRNDKYTITYVGTLSDNYPVEGLIPGLNNLTNSGIDFNLRFVGTVSEKTKNLLKSQIHSKYLEFLPYAAHSEAIKFMYESSLLLLIIPLHLSNKSIITGKLFEYLASEKPVLCLGPADGDAAEIIRNCHAGQTFGYYSSDDISDYLINIRSEEHKSDKAAIASYSRINLVRRIVEVLESKEKTV